MARHHKVSQEGWSRYYSCNSAVVYIVAVVNYYGNKLFDWEAYIWVSESLLQHREDRCEAAVREGTALSRDNAQYIFPHLPIEKWRD